MMRVMSAEEVKRKHDRVRHYWSSNYVVDHVIAILLDMAIAGSGLREETAVIKAHAILEQLRIPELALVNRGAEGYGFVGPAKEPDSVSDG